MSYTKTTFVDGGPPGISAAELNKIGQGIADAHVAAENVSAEVVEHAGVVAGDNQLGHVMVGDGYSTGLELNSNTLRVVNRPIRVGGSVEYTDSLTGPTNAPKTIWTNRLHFPYRLLMVLLRNKSDPEKFIKYEIDPYSGEGFVTGINSNGKTITMPTVYSTAHGVTSSTTDVGYGVASSGRVGIQVKYVNSSGYIEATFSVVDSGAVSLNVKVDWMLC